MRQTNYLAWSVLHLRDGPAAFAESPHGKSRHSAAARCADEGGITCLRVAMPRHYIDQESDRDALFASRNLVSVEFAAEQLKVSPHMLEKSANRTQGPFLIWVFGTPAQLMRKYRELYVDMGPSPGPDDPHAWQKFAPQELLGEARQHLADPTGLGVLRHASQ